MKDPNHARMLLDHYRDSLSTSVDRRERLLLALEARVARGEQPATDPREFAPLAKARLSRWLVTSVVLGATALLVLGGILGRGEERPEPVARVAPAPTPAPESISEPAEAAAPAPAETFRSPERQARPKQQRPRPRSKIERATVREPTPAPESAPTPAPEVRADRRPRGARPGPEPDDLKEELRLIRAAYAALRAERVDVALARASEHAARFPHGKLAEARDVARIMALCQSGDTGAGRAEARRFLARAPESAYAARVKTLCSER